MLALSNGMETFERLSHSAVSAGFHHERASFSLPVWCNTCAMWRNKAQFCVLFFNGQVVGPFCRLSEIPVRYLPPSHCTPCLFKTAERGKRTTPARTYAPPSKDHRNVRQHLTPSVPPPLPPAQSNPSPSNRLLEDTPTGLPRTRLPRSHLLSKFPSLLHGNFRQFAAQACKERGYLFLEDVVKRSRKT